MVAIILPGRNGPMIGGGTPSAGGGFSLISHAAAAGPLSGPTTTGAINTSGANLLVVAVSQLGSQTAATLTDSKSNTWTGLTAKLSPSTAAYNRLYYCASPTVGSGHTFSITNGGILAGALAVQAWSGANVSPFDVENGGTGGGVTSVQTGSVTPNQNNSLIVTGLCVANDAPTDSINSSFTISDQVNWASGVNEGVAMAYLLQGTAGAVNPTWSWTNSAQAAATIAVFKP